MRQTPVASVNFERGSACESLILESASLVHALVQRIWSRCPAHIELQDLQSAAACGLVEAARSFDSSRGVSFEAFAVPRIRGAILDALRKMDWTPRSVLRKRRALAEAMAGLEARLGRAASDEEMAAEMGLPLEQYHRLLENVRGVRVESLFSERSDEDGGDESELGVEDRRLNRPDELLQDSEAIEALGTAIEQLRQAERLVVTLYFHEGLTLKEIGAVLGLTESRASQIKTAALLRLQGLMKAHR